MEPSFLTNDWWIMVGTEYRITVELIIGITLFVLPSAISEKLINIMRAIATKKPVTKLPSSEIPSKDE
jgi:hypothetical protein